MKWSETTGKSPKLCGKHQEESSVNRWVLCCFQYRSLWKRMRQTHPFVHFSAADIRYLSIFHFTTVEAAKTLANRLLVARFVVLSSCVATSSRSQNSSTHVFQNELSKTILFQQTKQKKHIPETCLNPLGRQGCF